MRMSRRLYFHVYNNSLVRLYTASAGLVPLFKTKGIKGKPFSAPFHDVVGLYKRRKGNDETTQTHV